MTTALHVEEWGTGVPVVLLHSSGLSGRQWRRLAVSASRRGFRALVPDLTGHGASAPWPEPEPFSFRTDVDRVVELLTELGRPAHVVGHSYGGLIALLSALSAPASIRSLVLIEPVAFGVLDPVTDADARTELARVELRWGQTAAEHERWLQAFVEYWGGPGAWSALREDMRAEFRRVAWVLREGVTTLGADSTPAAAYRVLNCPVVLAAGEQSPLASRRVVQRLGEVLPQARVVMIPNAGHMAPLTHPEPVNEIVLEALVAADSEKR